VPKNYVDYVDRDDGYILYVGDFRKQQNKGLTNFLMALDVLMSEDATIKAKVVGKRTNDERFQELISSNNKSRVSFLGMQTQEQTDILFRECSFFVMPSYYETFGIVYIQAMSCGKAVIGVKSENIIEVIDDGVNGLLLDVNNQEQLVEAVKKLWNDKALRQLLGGNGREKVIRDFTWDKTAERLLADYESILAEKT
jgi:glycosyltransferase involved in cell wall biosynthesis